MNPVLYIDDILYKIFTFVDQGSTFKAICFTRKQWNNLVKKAYPIGHIDFADHLLTLLKLYPNAPWDYTMLSENPNITWEYIIAFSSFSETKIICYPAIIILHEI